MSHIFFWSMFVFVTSLTLQYLPVSISASTMYKKTTVWGKGGAYTIHMMFPTAVQALEPKSQTAKVVAWIYTGILTIMAVSQLFAFEDFVPLFHDMAFPGGDGTGSLLAGLIVFSEIFAIPFLLRMSLSPLMRWFSLVLGLYVPLVWLFVSYWLVSVHPGITANAGILGTKVHISASVQLVLSLLLLVVAAVAARGLWPVRNK